MAAMIPIPIPRVDTEKKPEHVGVGLLQGLNKFGDHISEGAGRLWRKPQEGHAKEGALGAAKGLGEGVLNLTSSIGKGACDFTVSTLEGIRSTPDAVGNVVQKDRDRNKHGVEGEGDGEILETYIEDEKEPEHVGTGFMTGATGFAKGIMSGGQDFVNKPMEGAKKDGALGFAKGLGTGTLSFTTKTLSGSLDLVTHTLKGARNTPETFEKAVNQYREGAGSSSSAAVSAAGSSRAGRSASGSASGASGSFVAFSGDGKALGSSPDDAIASSEAAPAASAPLM